MIRFRVQMVLRGEVSIMPGLIFVIMALSFYPFISCYVMSGYVKVCYICVSNVMISYDLYYGEN